MIDADGAVDVWFASLATEPTAPEACLDSGEIARMRAFRRPGDRRRFGVLHVATRQILAGYLGIEAAAVGIGREPCFRCGGAHGKPFLAAGGPFFNVSRSRELAAVAVASRPVGIDVEWCLRRVDVDALARSVLAGRELVPFAQATPRERRALFFRRWTAKEAAVKAVGAGLSLPLGEVALDDRGRTASIRVRPDGRGVVLGLAELTPPTATFASTLATALPEPTVRYRSWPDDL